MTNTVASDAASIAASPPSRSNTTSSPSFAASPFTETLPFRTKSAAVQPSRRSRRTRCPARRRRSNRLIGVKLRAGPFAPSNSPAITLTAPASPGSLAVRMPADAALLDGRPEIGGAGVIEKQEGRQLRTEILVAEHRVHREAVAHPMCFAPAVNAAYVLRGVLCGDLRGDLQSVFHGAS